MGWSWELWGAPTACGFTTLHQSDTGTLRLQILPPAAALGAGSTCHPNPPRRGGDTLLESWLCPKHPASHFLAGVSHEGCSEGRGTLHGESENLGLIQHQQIFYKTTSLLWATPFEMGWEPAGNGEGKVSHLQLLPPSLRHALRILGLCHPSLPTRSRSTSIMCQLTDSAVTD